MTKHVSDPPDAANSPVNEIRLRRDLKLRDLIIYGVMIITPIAPVPLFGVAQEVSRGHAVTTILIAGVAMMLTAFSYGRSAGRRYPTPSCSAASLAPCTRFAIFWNATSRA